MKVSVIVLTYNSAATIRQALDSVLAQRCDFEYEIVVGDDASTDSTREILLEYAAKNAHIRLLLASANQGLQNNYYDCLEACRGTYIADCAGDDFWNNADRLQLMAEALDRNQKAGMVYTDWIKRDLSTGCEQLCHPTLMADISRRRLQEALLEATDSPAVNLSAAMFRRQIVMQTYEKRRDTLFRNRAFACEDLQLLMTLAHEADAEYLPIVSLCYNVGSSQAITSQDNAAKSVCFTMSSLRLRLELARLFKLDTPEIRRSEANALAFALGTAIDSDDKSLVKDVLQLAGEMRFIRLSTRVRMFFAKYCNFFC